jgi:pilus assembly protein Flp/PilA
MRTWTGQPISIRNHFLFCNFSPKFNCPNFPLRVSILADESGATAIEYGLIAAGISIAIIAAVKGVGTKLNTTFSSISSQLN